MGRATLEKRLCVLTILLATATAAPASDFNITVDGTLSAPITDPLDPLYPAFDTVQGAIDSIPQPGAGHYTITIYPGIYEETVIVRRPDVTLRGVTRDGVVLADSTNQGGAKFVMQIHEPNVTLENLTVRRTVNDADTVVTGLQMAIQAGEDDIVVENCRFMDVDRGMLVIPAPSSTDPDGNERIVVRHNLFETRHEGIHIERDGLGKIDFTSHANHFYIKNRTDDGVIGIFLDQLEYDSRFTSIADSMDLASDATTDIHDVQGYFFINRQARVSHIVSPRIRLFHAGRTSSLQGLVGFKVHFLTNGSLDDDRFQILITGANIHVEDRTPTGVGGGANIFHIGEPQYDMLVSGGSVHYDVDATDFARHTFFLSGNSGDSTATYSGFPVDTIVQNAGSVTPFDLGEVKATKGLVGSTSTVQIDDLADAALVDRAETISANWTHISELTLGDGTSSTPLLRFDAQNADWTMQTLSGGALQVFTNVAGTSELKFRNNGGNLNVRFSNGTFLPDNDLGTNLGGSAKRFSILYARTGVLEDVLLSDDMTVGDDATVQDDLTVNGDLFAKVRLHVPQAGGTPVLGDGQLGVDTVNKKVCLGIGTEVWCAALTLTP